MKRDARGSTAAVRLAAGPDALHAEREGSQPRPSFACAAERQLDVAHALNALAILREKSHSRLYIHAETRRKSSSEAMEY